MCTNCKKPYYISTAIAYTSGKPHIGNTYEDRIGRRDRTLQERTGYDVTSRQEPTSTARRSS